MSHELVTDVPQEDFQQAIQEYIHWASEWDGALPADVFFGAWAELQKEKETLSLKAHIVAGRLQFTASPIALSASSTIAFISRTVVS